MPANTLYNNHKMVCCARQLLLLLPVHPFNDLFLMTTWVNPHQKGKPFWILLEQEIDGVAVTSAGPYANQLHLAADT